MIDLKIESNKESLLFEKEEEEKLLSFLKPVLLSKEGVSLYLDLSPSLMEKACMKLKQNPKDMAHLLSFAFVFENRRNACKQRRHYRYSAGDSPVRVADGVEKYHLGVASPILSQGDLMGCVMLLMDNMQKV